MPKRIQRKRTKGWRMPPNCVYVGRPSKWGNPFAGKDAVEKYKWALEKYPSAERCVAWARAGGSRLFWIALASRLPSLLAELRGKDLCCWCKEGEPCHGDVLLQLANE